MNLNNNQEAFLALVRAGLWEKQVQLSPYKDINFSEVYRIAEEQSVIGLVAAGLEHVKVPHVWALQFAGQTIQLEQRNKAMNAFIAKFINMLSSFDINVILVKGQGIAQCYERPLWRSCGDVDLLLSDENYNKAKHLLIPKASEVESESLSDKHLGMTIEKWIVELHGSLHTELSSKLDKVVDSVQDEVFYHGCVRTWVNGEVQVFLPSPDNDVIFIFTHYLKHFYKGGLGLRQICDWCRLLWSYGQSLNYGLLESRLRTMGLMTEWKAFAAFAVEYLGMPVEVMPLFDEDISIPCVIDGIALYRQQNSPMQNVRLVAIGGGPLIEKFSRYAKDKNVDVTFTEALPYQKMVGLMCSCDVVINPIRKGAAQSITNKVGDYAFSGLAVINTQECQEYRDLIDEYDCGINCDCGNVEDISNAIKFLIENPKVCKKMGLGARKLGEEKINRESTYNCIIEAVENLFNNGK